MDETNRETTQMQSVEQFFHVVRFIVLFKVVLAFLFVYET